MAGKSYLIRDVPDDIRLRVEEACSEYHVTQQKFLMRILKDALDGNPTAALDLPAARRRMERESFTFIDLFSGIGGLRLGVEKAGGRCLFSSEWDANSQKTYMAWFGEKPHGDINQVDPKDIPNHDMLVAGFPCQPFSLAGVSKKKSLGRPHGFDDVKQGNLFFVLADIVAKKRPPMLLLENVKNLRSHDKGNTWKVIKSTLESLNYSIHEKLIDAANYVPQHRERIFIVGFDRDVFGDNPEFTHPAPPAANPRLRDILDPKVDPKYTLSTKLWEYSRTKMTELKRRPDFVFPGIAQYHTATFPEARLTMLASKSTCKDRWRQILNEAKRIDRKHLFTLEPSISIEQTDEMKDERVQLVLPASLHSTFKPAQQSELLRLDQFIALAKKRQVV